VRASRGSVLVLAVLALLSRPTTASADHGKIDVVVLQNGDRITCEILSLTRGKLSVKTDAMSTISIKWIEVEAIASPVPYEVELASGRRLLGSLVESTGKMLRVKTTGDEEAFEFIQVVRIDPMERGFWQRLDGSINLGFSFTEADTTTQWSLNADANRRTQKYLFAGSYDSLLSIHDSDDSDDDRQTRNQLTLVIQRFVSRRWFGALLTQGTQNEELGLKLRTVIAATAGRDIVTSNRTTFSAFAGVSYTREQFVDEPGEDRPEAVQGLRWDYFSFVDHEVDLSNSVLLFEGLDAGRRIRLELSSEVQFKIVGDLRWTLNLFESYDSAPPEEQKKNDLGISAALGWTF
jgi:hypothetical protein